MKVTSKYFKKEFDISKAELVGEGNFAQVYRIYDPEIDDSLAIRKVDKDQGQSEDIEKQRVINEQLKKVQNQNILQIYDIIETKTSVWYITEFCEGGSLWDALNTAKDNKMTQKDGLECILQISKGVQQLHNHRITHRDLKPENILLKTKYIPGKLIPIIKIADFGLSTKKIIMETIAGTKQYIAPEQARFHNYTNAVDVWSLGIICDEILHGNPFYIGDNNKQVFQKIVKNPYKVRDQSIRGSIKQFLLSLLKKKPYERPIIAVIRQNLQKILEQINNESGFITESISKKIQEKDKKSQNQELNKEEFQNKNDDKKEVKKVQIKIPTQESQKAQQNINVQQLQSQSSVNESFQDSKRKNKRFQRTQANLPKKQPVKQISKTPFKRQILQKNEGKAEQEICSSEDNDNKSGRVPLRNDIPGKSGNSALKPQKVQKQEQKKSPSRNHTPSPNQKILEKITVYKADTRRKVNYPKKQNSTNPFNLIDTKDYAKEICKIKEGFTKSNIYLKDKHQFVPNPSLTINDMPEKIETDELIKSFRHKYDYLNYFNASEDYEIKVLKGKREIQDLSKVTQDEIKQYKNKIKEGFLSQINRYVDIFVDKNIL